MNNKLENLINQIEIYSKKNFNYRNSIHLIIETCCTHKLSNKFNELIFIAKFLHNTKCILHRHTLPEENYDKLILELKNNLEQFIRLIYDISNNFNSTEKTEFENKFLNQNNFDNIMTLAEDLSLCKNYEIDKKIKILDREL